MVKEGVVIFKKWVVKKDMKSKKFELKLEVFLDLKFELVVVGKSIFYYVFYVYEFCVWEFDFVWYVILFCKINVRSFFVLCRNCSNWSKIKRCIEVYCW